MRYVRHDRASETSFQHDHSSGLYLRDVEDFGLVSGIQAGSSAVVALVHIVDHVDTP